MSHVNKLRITWLIFMIIASVLGYFFLLHGGVYGESAERNNQSGLIYQLEVYVGLVLLWPVAVYGWVKSALGGSNMVGSEAYLLQMFGYYFLYKIHAIVKFKST